MYIINNDTDNWNEFAIVLEIQSLADGEFFHSSHEESFLFTFGFVTHTNSNFDIKYVHPPMSP